MGNIESKQKVLELIKTLPVCTPNSMETQWTVRCPYCGDSSNPRHAHFSIKIDTSDDSPMVYRCLKDGVNHGLLTEDVLADLGIHLSDRDHEAFKAYMKKSTKYINNRRTIVQTEIYKVPVWKSSQKNYMKLNYINQRLGLHWSFEDAARFKVVFNLTDFMRFNEIESIDGMDDSDLLYEGDLHVHVAEGTFDIISVKENLKPNYENQIFYASCGYGYMTIMRYLISNGICNNIHLHVYADKDKDDREQFRYIRSDPLNEWFDHITLHRNHFGNEKDYGVPMDHIIDAQRKIR